MRINLLSDYRGKLTGERYYTAGEYAVPDEMPGADADALVQAGRAVLLEGTAVPADEPKAVPKRSKQR